MRILNTSLLLVLVLGACAAPCDDDPTGAAGAVEAATEAAAAAPAAESVAYRKDTADNLSRNTSVANSQTKTKDNVKVITKHRRDGTTVTIIKDRSTTKTKKDELTDSFDQSNHTLTADGVEDSTSLTRDHQHQVKEVDVVKKVDKERIVTDKNGNVISDTHKTAQKEKKKIKAKDKETQSLVHSVKRVDPAAEEAQASTEAPSEEC